MSDAVAGDFAPALSSAKQTTVAVSATVSSPATSVGTHAARPLSATQGTCYYETDTGQIFVFDGSAWKPLTGATWLQFAQPASPTSTIAFTSIPQTFAHLLLVIAGADDAASAGSSPLQVRLNNDSAGHYYWQSQGSTAANFTAQTTWQLPDGVAGSGGLTSTNVLFAAMLLIPNYAVATQHAILGFGGGSYGGGSGQQKVTTSAGFHSTAVAVTEVDLLPTSTKNWIPDTAVSLYGLV